jgi:hypothetical protein
MRAAALKLEISQMPGSGDAEKIVLKVISDEVMILVILKTKDTIKMHQKIILNQN